MTLLELLYYLPHRVDQAPHMSTDILAKSILRSLPGLVMYDGNAVSVDRLERVAN